MLPSPERSLSMPFEEIRYVQRVLPEYRCREAAGCIGCRAFHFDENLAARNSCAVERLASRHFEGGDVQIVGPFGMPKVGSSIR